MFNLHNLYKSLTLFIRLNEDLEWFKWYECQKNPNKDKNIDTNSIPNISREYTFSENDSTYNVFDKLNISNFYNTPEERNAFDKAMIIDSNTSFQPRDLFKLNITHWEKTSNYILSIIRNWKKNYGLWS